MVYLCKFILDPTHHYVFNLCCERRVEGGPSLKDLHVTTAKTFWQVYSSSCVPDSSHVFCHLLAFKAIC